MSWSTIIRHYRKKHLPKHNTEISWFINQPTITNAIRKAAFAENERGKRYDHQRRIPRKVLEFSFRKLRAIEDDIGACKSFKKLHVLILDVLKNTDGIGELYCYDTALRIGAKLNLYPRKVMLHAGTRVGASLITNIRGRSSIGKKDLPRELRCLPAEQVEDILCIYKDKIEELYNIGKQ